MFIAALFIIAKNRKQPRCLSVGEWLKELEHLNHGILLRNKNNGLLMQAMTLSEKKHQF